MGSAGSGIVFFLSAAVSAGAFTWRAEQKGKRPGIASIPVAVLLVPLLANSVAGSVTLPVSAIATRVPGLSIIVNLVFVVVMIGACAVSGYALASIMGVPRQQEAGEVLRGTQLATSDRWRKRTDRMRTPAITVAGLAIDRVDEPKHFVMMGTTGTGKSVAIREMLRGAAARGDWAIIADPDGSFLSRFYDASRGDIILNPFDARSATWDLMGEVPSDFAAEQLAASLIPTPGGSADATWAARARTLLTAILRRGRAAGIGIEEVYRPFGIADGEELRTLLAGTAAEPFLPRARRGCLTACAPQAAMR